ncbi:hypothetical protein WBG99_07045 [Streptomyces sp. TG1A-60]|uniref:hypothetical protein n=1 Tax=Streptomyces sp. TG1A-60 TaxID=3129111 RepID=UPI0030D22916
MTTRAASSGEVTTAGDRVPATELYPGTHAPVGVGTGTGAGGRTGLLVLDAATARTVHRGVPGVLGG